MPGVPQASGPEIVGLPAHSTRSSLPGIMPAPDLWNAGAAAHRFRAATGLGFQLGLIVLEWCGLPPCRGRRRYEIEWKRVQEDVDLHAELA